MKTWDAWFPDVMVHATSAPDPLVRLALCRASREFFRKTRAWVEWLDAETTSTNAGEEHDFDLPTQTELLRVEQATADGRPLAVSSYRQRPADWVRHTQGGGQGVISRDLVSFYLVGGLQAGAKVQVQASLIPTLNATGLPDHLGNRFFEAITEGAKSILLMTPGDFFKPELAALSQAVFMGAINSHAVDAYKGHTAEVPRARPKWC